MKRKIRIKLTNKSLKNGIIKTVSPTSSKEIRVLTQEEILKLYGKIFLESLKHWG